MQRCYQDPCSSNASWPVWISCCRRANWSYWTTTLNWCALPQPASVEVQCRRALPGSRAACTASRDRLSPYCPAFSCTGTVHGFDSAHSPATLQRRRQLPAGSLSPESPDKAATLVSLPGLAARGRWTGDCSEVVALPCVPTRFSLGSVVAPPMSHFSFSPKSRLSKHRSLLSVPILDRFLPPRHFVSFWRAPPKLLRKRPPFARSSPPSLRARRLSLSRVSPLLVFFPRPHPSFFSSLVSLTIFVALLDTFSSRAAARRQARKVMARVYMCGIALGREGEGRGRRAAERRGPWRHHVRTHFFRANFAPPSRALFAQR